MKTRITRPWSMRCFIAGAAMLSLIASLVLQTCFRSSNDTKLVRKTAQPASFQELTTLSPDAFADIDIGLINLLCAESLPGAQGLDVSQCLQTLNQWANRVRAETERNWPLFERQPQSFQNSTCVFQMVMLGSVLREDFGVRYNPRRMAPGGVFEVNELFFADSRDVFLHGLLSGNREGTCSS